MKLILKLTIIILMALLSFKAYPKGAATEPIYELILDFGEDFSFIHEVTTLKWYCEARVRYIVKRERVRAYCVKRQ
jgi:hypothetical protein